MHAGVFSGTIIKTTPEITRVVLNVYLRLNSFLNRIFLNISENVFEKPVSFGVKIFRKRAGALR